MINRVTHQTIQRSTLANVQLNLASMARLQAQMSSGKKVNVPSDDPAVAGQAMHLRNTQRQITQYVRNAADGDSWLTTVDSTLMSSVTALNHVRDLVVQSGNGGLGLASKQALAVEIDGLKDDLLALANTTYQGRTVFAGTSDAGVAYTYDDGTGTYGWTGVAGASVERRIGSSTTMRVDADGSQIFGGATGSVFQLLDEISAGLRADTDVTVRLDDVDSWLQSMLTAAASNGSRQRVLKSVSAELSTQALTVKTQLSAAEDIDLAEVIMDIQLQEVAYRGALNAGARVLQPTLLDFIR